MCSKRDHPKLVLTEPNLAHVLATFKLLNEESYIYTQEAGHQIWLILMTLCKKLVAFLKILPVNYTYESRFQAKFQGHSCGGEESPHNLRLQTKQQLFTSIKVTNSTYDYKNAVSFDTLKAFFDHSQENKSGLELKITPGNSPNFSRLAF